MKRGVRVAAAVAVVAVALAGPARAAAVGTVLEAPTGPALSVTVSQALFKAGSTSDVVVVDEGRPALVAVAAAFAGLTDRRAPVLLAGAGVSDNALRDEVKRVAEADAADPARVWLFGTKLDKLDGYDVRTFTGSDGDIAAATLETGPGAGTANRVLVFPQDDWRAGAIAAAFGAAWGVPAIPLGAGPLPTRLADVLDAERDLVAVAVGAVNVPSDRFARVDKVEGATPASLSAAAAKALFEPEHPAGAPIEYPLEGVAADGFGSNPAPALLTAVVTAFAQDDHGAKALPFLVDGKLDRDPAAGCAAKGRDEPAVCALAQLPATTFVLAVTAAAPVQAPRDRLPATGGSGAALGSLVIASWLAVRRLGNGVEA